jgi:WD40 repeat protein
MTKRKKILTYTFLPLGIIIIILAYYQLFYKSPRVDNGVAVQSLVFTGHTGIVTSVRFLPGDSLLVTGSIDSTIKIWERTSGKIVQQIKHPDAIAYLDLSTDGKYIVTGSYDSKVRLWRISDGALIKEFTGHTGTVWTVAFSNDGTKIAAGGDDAMVLVWDIATGALLQKLQGHKRIVWSVKFSPDDSKIASASYDFTLRFWNVADGKLLWDNKEHTETVVDLAFSHDGKLLASTSDDKTIRIWDVQQQKLVRTMKVAEHVQAVAFSPDDKRLMTGGRDKPMIGEFLQNFLGNSEYNKGVSARLWEVATGKLLHTFTSHSNDVMDLDYSHDGTCIATASADKTVEVWRIVK